MSKDKQIKIIIDLLKRSDFDFVDNVYKLLLEHDLLVIPKVLDQYDGETLKDGILEDKI